MTNDENPILKNMKDIDENLYSVVKEFQTNIMSLNTEYNSIANDTEFGLKNLFGYRYTQKLGKLFNQNTNSLKDVHNNIELIPSKTAKKTKLDIYRYILNLILTLKRVEMKFKLMMCSSGKYLNNDSTYHKAFPLNNYHVLECDILTLENSLYEKLIQK